MNYFTSLVIIILAWNLAPIVGMFTLPVPLVHKLRAMVSMLAAFASGLLVFIPDMAAPIVVPIALLFTPRDADQLPLLFRWWDNDVSINGDQPEGAETYYAPGHDRRSFYARFVWLGLRNRASRLAQLLGHRWSPEEYADAEHWGDSATGRDHEGWTLNRRGRVYQLYAVQRQGAYCWRTNYGFKVWAGEGDHRPAACVVNVSVSLLAWTGA